MILGILLTTYLDLTLLRLITLMKREEENKKLSSYPSSLSQKRKHSALQTIFTKI